jgi:hypothetical protein
MEFSKAKLKSTGDRTSPSFKTFLIGNMSDKFSSNRSLLYISDKHIFIILTSFMGIPLTAGKCQFLGSGSLFHRKLTQSVDLRYEMKVHAI